MDLTKGNIIKIHWYQSKPVELSQDKKEELRNQGMQKQVEVVLNQMLYGQADVNDLRDSVVKGRGVAKQAEKMELTELAEVWVQIGQKETPNIINQVENTPGFQGWVNPFTIEKIKRL